VGMIPPTDALAMAAAAAAASGNLSGRVTPAPAVKQQLPWTWIGIGVALFAVAVGIGLYVAKGPNAGSPQQRPVAAATPEPSRSPAPTVADNARPAAAAAAAKSATPEPPAAPAAPAAPAKPEPTPPPAAPSDGAIPSTDTDTLGKIARGEDPAYADKKVVVDGVVRAASVSSSGKVLRIEFGDANSRDSFVAVVFPSNDMFKKMEDKFGGTSGTGLAGKHVRIRGTLEMYQTHPEIRVTDVKQIEVAQE